MLHDAAQNGAEQMFIDCPGAAVRLPWSGHSPQGCDQQPDGGWPTPTAGAFAGGELPRRCKTRLNRLGVGGGAMLGLDFSKRLQQCVLVYRFVQEMIHAGGKALLAIAVKGIGRQRHDHGLR